jgi:glucose-1-phosphate thymidylyltransferase
MPPVGVVVFAGQQCQSGGRRATTRPLALEEVANRPIAHHVLDALADGGVDEVVLVGSAGDLLDIRASLRDYAGPLNRIEWAICPERYDMVKALRAAAGTVGSASCVVHLGDGLLGEPLGPHLEPRRNRDADVVVLCRPSHQDSGAPSAAGIAIFGPGVFAEACRTGRRVGPSGLDVVAQHLQARGERVELRQVEEWQRYTGNPGDLLDLNRLVLDGLAAQPRPVMGPKTRIEGRVLIDPSATISESVIVGPAVIGPEAEILGAYIGPYTSIGARARIEGAEIERSIVSPAASVVHVGGRLVSSLVGAGARVFRDFSVPRALRIRVSDGDEVALG